MARAAEILYLSAVSAFVGSGLALAMAGGPAAPLAAPVLALNLDDGPLVLASGLPAVTLPRLYMQPQNPLMWALLVTLWLVLLADAVDQYREPSDRGAPPAWLPLSLALIVGAAWPWLAGIHRPIATLGALLMLTAALSGAIRARGQRRAAPGFLAGWSLALGTATLATLIGAPLSLTTPQTAIVAILPGAVIGMVAQERLGRSLGFSVAMIWAFCAVAVTTMASSPGVALAAIIGISGMGVVLVRAAT